MCVTKYVCIFCVLYFVCSCVKEYQDAVATWVIQFLCIRPPSLWLGWKASSGVKCRSGPYSISLKYVKHKITSFMAFLGCLWFTANARIQCILTSF